MATSEDVIKFQELSNNDRILCTTRDHTRDLSASVQCMELVDKIREIQQESLEISGLDANRNSPLSRSTILLCALRDYQGILEADLLAIREMRGML